mmetsp:Transcript_62654/g.148401  ORF Transcript_62654/g.148401 Transcript_62654/m.148401 type:complete len:341 (+) Transcript_62654:75-1097(+)
MDNHYANVTNLPPHLAAKAARELGETPEVREPALAELRQLIASEPDIEWVRHDDWYLLAFLRCKKFKVDRAFQQLKNYTAFWNENKHLVGTRDQSALRRIYEPGFSTVLPGTDRNGCRVGCLLPAKMKLSGLKKDGKKQKKKPQFTLEDMLALNLVMTDYMLQDPELQVNGMMMLENFDGFSLRKCLKWRKSMQGDSETHKKLMSAMAGIAPIRLRGIVLLNAPWYISLLLAVSRPFMPKKMRSRVYSLGSGDAALASLRELMDPADLPSEFGGTLNVEPTRFWDNYAAHRPLSDYFTPGPTQYMGTAVVPGERLTEEMQAAMQHAASTRMDAEGITLAA